jgi:hypothetical protein
VDVQLRATELKECALDAQEIPHTVLRLECADALQDIGTKEDSVLLVVDPTRSFPMDNAAVLLASTPSMASAANATGMRSMTKASESAESHAMPRESTTSKPEDVSASPSSSNWLMGDAAPAHFTQPSTQ